MQDYPGLMHGNFRRLMHGDFRRLMHGNFRRRVSAELVEVV